MTSHFHTNPTRLAGLGLRTLAVLTLATAAPAAWQGKNIGDPTGRAGLWPLLATPQGNPFQAHPNDDYAPLPGSHTDFLVMLGFSLFWDEQVSTNNTVACATCHIPEAGGLDPRTAFLATNNGFGSSGVLPMNNQGNYIAGTSTSQQRQVTGVTAPTMIGAAFAEKLFWNVRAGPDFPMALPQSNQFLTNAGLEAQAVGPPGSKVEMAHNGLGGGDLQWGSQGAPGQLENKLNPSKMLALATFSTVPAPFQPFVSAGITYQQAFDAVFNMPSSIFPGNFGVTRERFAVSVAAYERTLVPNQAPIDTRALTSTTLPVTTPSEQRGFDHLAASQCFKCHANQTQIFGNHVPQLTGTGGFQDAMDAMLTDNRRHPSINFPSPPGATGSASGSFGVKTPSLRNVMLRPRWGHNGVLTTVNDMLSFYNGTLAGTNPLFRFTSGSGPGGRLNTNELNDVTAFFDALTDPRLIPSAPGAPLSFPFWHPDLYSQRFPFGSTESPAHPGTPSIPGGQVPDIILHTPARSGGAHFNVGLRDAPALSTLAALGVSPGGLPVAPIPPLMLNTAGLVVFNLLPVPPTGTVTDASGFATVNFPPLPVITAGLTFSFQMVILDPANNGLAWSNAGTVTIQP
ncbi:MAG: hypothetical protein CMJ89_03130 [Planctomycetes bacterium]|nr:hypothetical protein [Planctomycetota bacterium]